MTKRLPLLWAVMLLFIAVAEANAGLTFSLAATVQPGTGTYAVVFSGALSNTSSSANLYLNSITISFTGSATNYLGAISNAFYANVPGLLPPGGSYSDTVFAVSVARATPANTYSGTVTIQGGTNIFDTTISNSQTFQVAWLDSVGDGILDWWRQEYFGGSGTTTSSVSCALCDADGTGQNNFFKYIAGLDPTNPAAVFTTQIATVPGTNQTTLVYTPAVSGRAYNYQSSTNLVPGAYAPLTAPTVQTNGNQITVIDQNANGPQLFYRVGVSVP
jgi:hypothetical protein